MRLTNQRCVMSCSLAAMIIAATHSSIDAANQTPDLSPIVIGGSSSFSLQIQNPLNFPGATLPTLHSFVKANYKDPNTNQSQWLVMGGMTNGLHNLGGVGFEPSSHNKNVYVIDPITQQVWSRSLEGSGLTQAQVESLATTNAQATQKGSRLYISGGYGPVIDPQFGSFQYRTFDNLTSVDLPGMINWVKNGTGNAGQNLRQISDPIFQVTGGEMATTANGKTHLVFGQNYEDSYEPRLNGIYTHQVRTFSIVDDGTNLSIASPTYGATHPDFRRRDLNVVPTIKKTNGELKDQLQALSGVFTQSFGAWTVPVNIDENGIATQANPAAPDTFKQGMNGYRCANLGLYSASSDKMHTLLMGGISYQYFDPQDGQIHDDQELPFISSITDVITDADGKMSQRLLPTSFPDIISPSTGKPLLLGAQTDFFLKDGIETYSNGVINLDALTGPTLVGWLYGGIAAEQPNGGPTFGSNAVFPVIITPTVVPEPANLTGVLIFAAAGQLKRRVCSRA